MAENASELPNQNNCGNPAANYLDKAAEACAAGDLLLGMHLYLAAYEQAAADPDAPASVAVAGLREAWHLACDLKERSIAEYVFEKLEPYLTGDEFAECAEQLQELALDRLEQFGFSRDELEDMAEAISQDFLGADASVVKVESISIPNMGMFGVPDAGRKEAAAVVDVQPAPEASTQEAGADEEAPRPAGKPSHVDMGVADASDFNPYEEYCTDSVGTSYHAATNEGSGAYVFTRDRDRATALERAEAKAQAASEPEGAEAEEPAASAKEPIRPGDRPDSGARGKVDLSKLASTLSPGTGPSDAPEPDAPEPDNGPLSYRNLAGYDEAVAVMRDLGVGLQGDAGFLNFVRMMNSRHGLGRMPSFDTMFFRAPVIEDANRFAEATCGELGLPVLRMSMEEGVQGMPVLCVTTQGNNRPRMNHAHNRFEGPGILILEDLDMWVMPEMPDTPEGFNAFMMANISRGAREAMSLIRSAVEDPDVFVVVTATTDGDIDPFFYELLEPITIIDIGYPTERERMEIWAEIARDHPSLRGIDRPSLVRFSEGLPRYDLYMAAREAVDEAYKLGLVQRTYLPVSPQNLFDKLAGCQPLDSELYRELEEAVIEDFKSELDHLEDILGGAE